MSTIAATAETSPERSFIEVWLISIGHTLTHWYPATFYLLLPLIGKELNLSYSEIGSILTAQFAASTISNVPGGLLVDTVRRKNVLMAISLFWIGFPYLLMGFTHSYWMLLGCSALIGMGNNLWHPTAIPLLANHFPRRRGLVVSFHSMGGNVGDALAPLAVGALLIVLGWREVVVVNLIPGVIMAIVLLTILGRTDEAPDSGRAESPAKLGAHEMLDGIKALLRNRAVVLLSTSSAFRTMTQSALLTFLPVFLAGQMGYSPVWVGACMFILQAAGFAAAPIAGHLSDKMGRRRIIMSSMAVTAAVLIFMALAGTSPAFVIFVSFLGFFLFAIRAVLQAWLLDAVPKQLGGTSIGIMFGSQAVGAAIGPFAGGLLADHYGLSTTFYFLAVTIVIANLFIFFTPATTVQPASATNDG